MNIGAHVSFWIMVFSGYMSRNGISGSYGCYTFSFLRNLYTVLWGLLRWLSSKEPALQCRRHRRHGFDPWVGKIHWRRDRLPTPVFLGFPCGSVGKESTCNAGEPGSIPGWGRSPEEGNDYPLQYACLENSMDRGAWKATVQGCRESDTMEWLSLHFILLT